MASAVAGLAQQQAPADPPTRLIEVYFRGSKSVAIPGVTNAVVLDESVCSVQPGADQVQVVGLSRGQSPVLVWMGEQRLNLLVRVVDPPVVAQPPSLRRFSTDEGAGLLRTLATSNSTASGTGLMFNNQFEWQQTFSPGHQLRVMGSTLNDNYSGGHRFNLASGSVNYHTPKWELDMLDFAVLLRGPAANRASAYLPMSAILLRGADFRMQRGKNNFEFFGGTGVPSYYLNYAGTLRAAGFGYQRRMNDRVSLYSTGLFSSAMQEQNLIGSPRRNEFTLLSGVDLKVTRKLNLEANAGVSTSGNSVNAAASYDSGALSSFAAFSHVSPDFTFRALRLTPLQGDTLIAGASYRLTRRWSVDGVLQHRFALSFNEAGSHHDVSGSNNLSLNTQYLLSNNHQVGFAYTFNGSTASGGLVTGRVQRIDINENSMLLGQRLQNSARFYSYWYGAGAVSSDAHREYAVQDTLRYRLRPSVSLLGGISYGHSDLSLVDLLRQQISMLSPADQDLFRLDPIAFINSPLLPPGLRSILENLQPSNKTISVGAEISRDRWSVSPNLQIGLRSGAQGSNLYQFGYTATFNLSRSILLQSSLTHQYFVDDKSRNVHRATQFTVGMFKSLHESPVGWISGRFQQHSIHGRVFVDKSISGAYRRGDPGLAGARVALDDGTVATTDASGEFEFKDLAARTYRVSIPLDQFSTPVRMTTSSPVIADLKVTRRSELAFGVVNFARVLGNVFNDYQMDGLHLPDAPGLSHIKMVLTDKQGGERTLETDAGGGFEFSEIEPGDYTLTVDAAALPADYALPRDTFPLHVGPTSSVITDVPVRALRSIAGKVLFREKKDDPNAPTRPLAGITVAAGQVSVKTSADGSFLLRGLPAGELVLRVVPSGELPAGAVVPSGAIRLRREPQQVEGVTIVITNPDLLNYLQPRGDAVAMR